MSESSNKPSSGGAAPYGFRRGENGFEPDPTESPIRKLIFELFLKHKRKLTVAKILNEKGYRTRTGAKFSDSSIDRFLRDPIAKGHHRDNFTDKKYRKLKSKSEWRFPPIEPIIDEVTWNQVNEILVSQKRKPASKKYAGLFTGLLYCDCGAKMHYPHGRKKYFCSSCDNSIEVIILEKIYASKLDVYRSGDQRIARTIKNNNNAQDRSSQIENLKNQKLSVEQEMDKLYDLYISSAITKSRFTDKNMPLHERLSSIDSELSNLAAKSIQSTKSQPANLNELFPSLSQSTKRGIVDILTKQITVGATHIKIAFALSPSS